MKDFVVTLLRDIRVNKLPEAAAETVLGWYKRTNSAGLSYYTPIKDTKMEWLPIGDGIHKPTLRELADAANAIGAHSTYDFHVEGLMRRDTDRDESGEPIELPSGTYTHHRATGSTPEHLLPFDLRKDVYVHMPNVYDQIVRDIRDFVAAEDQYRSMQIQYRRGLFLFGPPGNGKCLGKDTPVLMFNGTIKMVQDIYIGDLLMGPDSKPRRVTSTTQGQERLYKIIPYKGDPYIVNESHILSLQSSGGYSLPTGTIDNISVIDYLNRNADYKHHMKGYRSSCIDFVSQIAMPIDPYLIGYWLGDGNSASAAITTMDPEIVESFNERLQRYGLELHQQYRSGRAITYRIANMMRSYKRNSNQFATFLRQYHLINNKHIPYIYATASRSDRLRLLAGLIDSDGYLNNNTYDITIKNTKLAEGILFVARSLGLAAYSTTVTKSCMYKGQKRSGQYIYINISGDVGAIPVILSRKKAKIRRQKKNVLRTGITLEPLPVGDYYGFELEGPDHRFLLGDFTVTHNTALVRDVLKNELPADTVCIFLDEMPSDGFLATIKATLSDRLKIFVFEEMVNVLSAGRCSGSILDFLDGERSIDKSMVIATTNYPELIPGNIVDRPSRFDRLYRVDNPNADLRRLLLKHFIGADATDELVTETDGLSIAALREVSILVRVRKMTPEQAAKQLKHHHQMVQSEFKGTASIGINVGNRFDPTDFDD